MLNFTDMQRLVHKFFNIQYEIFKVLPFLIVILLIVWLMPGVSKFRYEYHLGKPWQHTTLIAPFDFTIHKTTERLKAEREQLTQSLYPYFSYHQEEVEAAQSDLEHKLDFLEQEKNDFTANDKQFVLSLFSSVYRTGVLQYDDILDQQQSNKFLNLVQDKSAQTIAVDELYSVASAYEFYKQQLEAAELAEKERVLTFLSEGIVQNIVFDARLSNQELELALERISPVYGLVQKGELIISEGETVDEEKYLIINSLRAETDSISGDNIRYGLLLGGRFLLVVALMGVLLYYLRYFKPDIYSELKKVNLVLLLVLLVIIPSYIIIDNFPEFIYLFPFGILPILLITFFDSRTTFLIHLITIFLVAISISNAFQFVFQQIIVGYIVVFSFADHSRRLYFFRTTLFIFLSYIVIFAGFNLLHLNDINKVNFSLLWLFAGSSLLTLLALPFIFILERSFGLVTDLTLLELSNTNSPLLHELASKAPGTFQHSMQVANLAEEALYAIDGDVLLARTGALYHDIGKMENPYFYIENQLGAYNPHDDLPPRESAAIIIGHVLSGIEKARKAKLPDQIIDFIRTHHGTSRANYFYVMEQRLNPGIPVDERDFRYNGPIPFSKETAVVMMADAVEAASRSIKNPTEQKINDLIENIVSKQFEDGQYLNANITLKELNTVKKILKKKLLNIYHVRLAYPE